MKGNIMIVDDSKVNRDFLRAVFLTAGYKVTEAVRGGEALEMIETDAPDLMILDLNMPGIGGLETLRSIKAKGFTFPVIIFTSDSREEIRLKCIDAGATEILVKPSKPNFMLSLVNKYIVSKEVNI
jgi:two-component system, OmpR family, KDP operon response regulator KdpE